MQALLLITIITTLKTRASRYKKQIQPRFQQGCGKLRVAKSPLPGFLSETPWKLP